MKYTLRFLIVSLCILCSTMAFADQRGADLFKAPTNRTSPSQWTNARSGNSFSYSRYGESSYGSGYAVGSSRGIYGSSTSTSIYGGDRGENQYAEGYSTGDFFEGGPSDPQYVRGTTTSSSTSGLIRFGSTQGQTSGVLFDPWVAASTPNTPLSDALPCLSVILIAFAAFKFRRQIVTFIKR